MFPVGSMEQVLEELTAPMALATLKSLQTFKRFMAYVATGAKRKSGKVFPNFHLDQERYGTFTLSLKAMEAMVTSNMKKFQRQTNELANKAQRDLKWSDDCKVNPEKVVSYAAMLKSDGEEILQAISTWDLDELLAPPQGNGTMTPLDVRNTVWAFLLSVGQMGRRGCEARGMKLAEWDNRLVLSLLLSLPVKE